MAKSPERHFATEEERLAVEERAGRDSESDAIERDAAKVANRARTADSCDMPAILETWSAIQKDREIN